MLRGGVQTFVGLIEVFHDLAVRPRAGNLHTYGGCGWNYSAFTTDVGRAIYRWKINRLLEFSGVKFRLADDGEDLGRLVHLVDDARTDLIERALASREPEIADRVGHAIANDRRRMITRLCTRSRATARVAQDRARAECGRSARAGQAERRSTPPFSVKPLREDLSLHVANDALIERHRTREESEHPEFAQRELVTYVKSYFTSCFRQPAVLFGGSVSSLHDRDKLVRHCSNVAEFRQRDSRPGQQAVRSILVRSFVQPDRDHTVLPIPL